MLPISLYGNFEPGFHETLLYIFTYHADRIGRHACALFNDDEDIRSIEPFLLNHQIEKGKAIDQLNGDLT